MGWIILLVLAVCFVGLIAVGNKQKKLSESLPRGLDFKDSSSADMPLKEIRDLKQGPPQVTIYGYKAAGKMRLCPVCDGENEDHAARCRICGQPLKEKEVRGNAL